METKKLYFEDTYKHSFNASVVKAEKDESGRFYVVLNRTAFYPTGGGQPHDTGTLNNVHVFDVQEMDGEVRHYTQVPIDVHTAIEGKIDWERRFDHMQQHAGQHILSAAFEDGFGHKTIGFHLGPEICTIDLDVTDLQDDEIMQVENKVNQIILENRQIVTKWVDEEELSQYPLRKEVSVNENIRLVIIPEFDYNGCGGTHPDSTGQVASLKILHWERQKKNIRVYFVCGNRVLKQLGMKHQVILELMNTLNAPQGSLNDMATRVLQQRKEMEKKVKEIKMELINHEAEMYIQKAEKIRGQKIIQAVLSNRSMVEMKQLALQITANSNEIIVLFVNETVEKLQLVCASGEYVDIKMIELVKKVLPFINGKGGGNASFAQGGGEKSISPEKLVEILINTFLT